MDFLSVIAVALGLGADAMSVCIAVGVKWNSYRTRLRLALHMGLFQFFMPILGWLAGKQLADILSGVGKFIAAGLVMIIGAKMLWEVLRHHPGEIAQAIEHAEERAAEHITGHRADPTRGLSLITLSVATSIDALVVGFSLGLRDSRIFFASIIIGIVACLMALVGFSIGKRAGQALGTKAELAGAVILILLGIGFLFF